MWVNLQHHSLVSPATKPLDFEIEPWNTAQDTLPET